MEVTDLRHFANVARAGSFSGGAQRSHVTTPAVSKAVRKLEDELGVTLFERTTRHVRLTEAGRRLLGSCGRVFAELDSLQAELEQNVGRIGGEVRVAAMEVLSIELLPKAIGALVRAHLDVTPQTYEVPPGHMPALLKDGRVEVAFTIGSGNYPGIRTEPIGQSRPVLVCGRSHPLYGRPHVRKADLSAHASVVPRFLGMETDAPEKTWHASKQGWRNIPMHGIPPETARPNSIVFACCQAEPTSGSIPADSPSVMSRRGAPVAAHYSRA